MWFMSYYSRHIARGHVTVGHYVTKTHPILQIRSWTQNHAQYLFVLNFYRPLDKTELDILDINLEEDASLDLIRG